MSKAAIWFNRHLVLELAALGIAATVCMWGDRLEHFGPLRLGAHVDAVSILVGVSLVCGVFGLALPTRQGQSKRLALVVFILTFAVLLLFPALLPGTGA